LSLRLYLDDCVDSKRLCTILQQHGHVVIRPRDADLVGAADKRHFEYAREHELILATSNPQDFEPLHDQHPQHHGIFAIYQDNNLRDMQPEDIARAIQNIVDADIPIAGQFIVLNHWSY
jgi:predicted nuclease of predicted toxin-antitoxin system